MIVVWSSVIADFIRRKETLSSEMTFSNLLWCVAGDAPPSNVTVTAWSQDLKYRKWHLISHLF